MRPVICAYARGYIPNTRASFDDVRTGDQRRAPRDLKLAPQAAESINSVVAAELGAGMLDVLSNCSGAASEQVSDRSQLEALAEEAHDLLFACGQGI